mmetsp:Transcript_9840/g.33366  ORF Transcript_9840/g.33366 Transcript_9840/m.33366 type:complete len:248 (+) Transcript_9840:674-1417(+)
MYTESRRRRGHWGKWGVVLGLWGGGGPGMFCSATLGRRLVEAEEAESTPEEPGAAVPLAFGAALPPTGTCDSEARAGCFCTMAAQPPFEDGAAGEAPTAGLGWPSAASSAPAPPLAFLAPVTSPAGAESALGPRSRTAGPEAPSSPAVAPPSPSPPLPALSVALVPFWAWFWSAACALGPPAPQAEDGARGRGPVAGGAGPFLPLAIGGKASSASAKPDECVARSAPPVAGEAPCCAGGRAGRSPLT